MGKHLAYKRNILKHLYFAGSLSCNELSALTEKSLPLTARILNDLIEEGFVEEKGYAQSTGGRRPQIYSLVNDRMYLVAVAGDQLITRIALLDMHNNKVGETRQLELPLVNNPNALQLLTSAIDQFILQSGISKEKILGIGVGLPGFVDVTKGINHSYFRTAQGSITSFIESAIGIPVFIDNDSSLIALAELKFGEARQRQNAMVINISWGIGLGMIIKQELFRGNNGFAGEFSHIPIFSNNKMCSCGKMGCLETESSLQVIAQKAAEGLKEGRLSQIKSIDPQQVEPAINALMHAAAQGDSFSIDLFSKAAYNIGRGVAILIHLMNPELVILSGRGAQAGKLWLAPIQQAINEHCIPKIAENTDVRVSALAHQAALYGAAALVMDNLGKLDYSYHHVTRQNQVA